MEELSVGGRLSTRRSESLSRVLSCVAVFVGVLFLRSPHLFTSPRFWGEEGVFYFSALQDAPPWEVLTLVVRGNFQLLTNVFAYLATLVPTVLAPAVTTCLGLAVSGVVAGLVGVLSLQLGWSQARAITVSAILALLPAGYEVYLSATNAQWVCAVGLLLLCVLDLGRITQRTERLIYAAVIACGLTGVPSALLAPAFLVRRFVAPSPIHFRIGVLLAVCGLIQIAVIAAHPHPDRSLAVDAYAFGLSLILQTMYAPLLTADVVNVIGTSLQNGSVRHALLALVVGVSIVVLAVRAASSSVSRVTVASILALWFGVTILQLIGAIAADPRHFLSGWHGARYFFLGSVCFVLVLAMGKRHVLPMALLACMFLAGIYQVWYEPEWRRYIMRGPSWANQIRACGDKRPCLVQVWPGVAPWTLHVK